MYCLKIFAYRLGLEPKLLAKIINSSSGRCWSSEVYNPCPGVVMGIPSANNYQGGFGSELMAKVRVYWVTMSVVVSTEAVCSSDLIRSSLVD